uniref:Stanniocalcin n=1 Tax=Astyanax mexicanus TaxID=7994 RepID=A0A3B1JAS7_ASTMX
AGAFACLERSTCDTEACTTSWRNYHFKCMWVQNIYNTLKTGKTFVKESIKCQLLKASLPRFIRPFRRCAAFQNILLITEVQEECYRQAWHLVGVARSTLIAIGEVLQATLLQSLMECDEDTVDMDTLFQLLQKKPCSADGETDGQDSFRWPSDPRPSRYNPVLHNRIQIHLFARSVQWEMKPTKPNR